MRSERQLTIAIDGPASAGKSTVAKMVAKSLGFKYVDSGAVYRALTWKVLEENIKLSDTETIINTALALDLKLNGSQVFVDSRDISLAIREPRIDQAISDVCQIKEVRDQAVQLLRQLGHKGGSPSGRGIVMEGRDIGTVVFPEAEAKFYLDASAQQRALRRFKEFKQRGIKIDLLELQEKIEQRDERDKSRKTGPLTKAEDAVYIDTTPLKPDEVTLIILRYVKSVLERDGKNWLYCLTDILLWPVARTLFNLKVRGQENVPLTGRVLLASNHVSYVDPVALSLVLPRMANFMARASLFRYPVFGWLLRHINCHPIKHEGMDKAAFENVERLLASGKLVVIYPEGTRSPTNQLLPGKPGVGLMVARTWAKYPDLTVVPAKLIGTERVLPRGAKCLRLAPIEVRFGQPIDLNSLEINRTKESYRAITEAIMQGIRQL